MDKSEQLLECKKDYKKIITAFNKDKDFVKLLERNIGLSEKYDKDIVDQVANKANTEAKGITNKMPKWLKKKLIKKLSKQYPKEVIDNYINN